MNDKLKVSLTTWVTLLVIGAVVPLVLFAWVTLREISRSSLAFRDQGQTDTTRALSLAVDGEVRSWKTALEALASSRSLQPGRWAEFYEEACQVAAQYGGWIVLTDAEERQLLNTLRPLGTPLPSATSPEAIGDTLKDGKPMVSDPFFGKVAQRFVVAVTVPVLREGKVRYALTMTLGPERLTQLLGRQQLPASWVAAINDRQRRVVTRSVLGDTRVGKPMVEWLAAATQASQSGIATGPLVDGRPGQVAFQRLQEVPWVVALAVPMSELQPAAPLWRFIIVGVILGLAAVGAAVIAGRRIAAPVARLAAAGGPLVRGEAVDLGAPSGIRQMRELQQALGEASVAIQSRYREREQAEETLRRANEALEVRVQERTVALAEANQALQAANAELEEDIQRRKRAEEALRESETRFRTIFEKSPIGKALIGTDVRFLGVNRALSEMLGYTQAELASMNVAAIIHPDDFRLNRQGLQRLLTGEQDMYRAEERYIHRNGHLVWGDVSTFLMRNPDGTPLQFINHIQDITERKRAEEEIRTLAKFPAENPHPILRLNRDGIILYANEVSGAVLREWRCSIGNRAPDPWPDRIREALARPSRRTFDFECGDRIYSFFVAPVPDAGYVNLYASDITDRKRAEDTLKQTLADLERSNQELEQFAYVASHDLQEPLRMVASFTQLLAQRYQDRLDQDAKEFIGFAVDGATRMQRLIQDLLAYSRVRTQGACLAPTDTQMALRDALENLRAIIQEAGAVVTHDELPTVLADAAQVSQVFQNLVGNAIKFRGEAPPRVHVSATSTEDEWVFSVADNGIGIDPQYFDRIFIIFQRLHPSHRYPGTGIGLALCRRIVQRHGGRIWVASASGQGATFFFTLHRQEGTPA
ncbi:MAG: PAS domain S-box protein [Candidatus Methylomirabilales bacterium]